MPLDKDARSSVVDALLVHLAATFRLYLETQFAHWNVQGPGFFELHRAFRKQYERLLEDVDRIAERVRALGATLELEDPPEALTGESDAKKLCKSLADAHAVAGDGAREAHGIATEAGDVASAMLLEELALCREKEAWQLRAYLGDSLTAEPAET